MRRKPPNQSGNVTDNDSTRHPALSATYKARLQLDQQILIDAHGNKLAIAPGMHIAAEINKGKRTVLEYLLSPVRKNCKKRVTNGHSPDPERDCEQFLSCREDRAELDYWSKARARPICAGLQAR